MDPITIAGLAGAGASIFGNTLGFFGSQANNAANINNSNLQFQQQMALANAQRMDQYNFLERNENLQRESWDYNRAMNLDMFQRQYDAQKDFATQGLRWKVADAAAAGIHPLFALGGAGAAFAPPSATVGANASPSIPSGGALPSPGSPVTSDPGVYLANMGQDVSRAITSTMTAAERKGALELQRQEYADAAESRKLDLELKRSQIARNYSNGQTGPGFPQVNVRVDRTGSWENKPNEVVTQQPNAPGAAAGPGQPSVDYVRTGQGLEPVPTKQTGVEDEFLAPRNMIWMGKNYLGQVTPPSMDQMKANFPGATGMYWAGHAFEWRPLYKNEKSPVEKYIDWRNETFGSTFGAMGRAFSAASEGSR